MIGGAGQWGGAGMGCAESADNSDRKRGIHQQWGFLVLDSDPNGQKGNATRVDYFEVQNAIGSAPGFGGVEHDKWPEMSQCFKANKDTPVTSCRDKVAFKWRSRPEPAPVQDLNLGQVSRTKGDTTMPGALTGVIGDEGTVI